MIKRKYEIEYKVKDRQTGKYQKGGSMTSKEVVEAESETNAIAKLKGSIAYKISSGANEWEIIKVSPK